MAFRRLFGRQESEKNDNPFANWPEAPAIYSAAFLGRLRALKPVNGEIRGELRPDKYGHALVIGLGETGLGVLQGWLTRLHRDRSGFQRKLRLVAITEREMPEVETVLVKMRQFNLQGHWPGSAEALEDRTLCRRAIVQKRFISLANFEPILSYVNAAIRELVADARADTDVRVIVVASIGDVEIGLLGDLLHVLHTSANRRFSNVTLLLAVGLPSPGLDAREQVAAMREIGRFTFSGRHLMTTLPHVEEESFEGALLDFVFLLEEDGRLEIPEAMTESLFTLLHPSAAMIWENLRNEVVNTGKARAQSHLPFVNSLGIAMLFVPVGEIEQYAAARLAYAALFGEQSTPEGLLAASQVKIAHEQYGSIIGREWLLNEAGRHPLWRWLLDANNPGYFRFVPTLTDFNAFIPAFESQLRLGMLRILNDPDQVEHLQKVLAGLRWLLMQLTNAQRWLSIAMPKSGAQEYAQLALLIERFVLTVNSLLQQVVTWETSLGVADSPVAESGLLPATPEPPQLKTALPGGSWRSSKTQAGDRAGFGDWRGQATSSQGTAGWRRPTTGEEIVAQDVGALRRRLLVERQIAEASFAALESGSAQRSLTYNLQDPLHEVRRYYEDAVRPELSRHDVETGSRFTRVRERLGWWIDLHPNRLPELRLVCLPVDFAWPEDMAAPPRESCFGHEDLTALTTVLLEVARAEINTVVNDMTGGWMGERLRDRANMSFLTSADYPLLRYDQREAMEISSSYASTPLRYLVGANRELTSHFKEAAFRNTPATGVNDVENAEPYLLTAFALRLTIPLSTVHWYNLASSSYDHQESLHLYAPEQVATRYEGSLGRARRARYEFPPELVMALTEERLVSIFCQAVLAGQIVPRTSDAMDREVNWTLVTPDIATRMKMYDAVLLARADSGWLGLWNAFVHFTLELPFGATANTRPAHPFYPANRSTFLDALAESLRAARRDTGRYQNQREEFVSNYLEAWQADLRDDLLGRAFLDLLTIEQSRPLWRGF